MNQLDGIYFEDLTVGRSAVFSKTITDADVTLFAGVSGDTNPVHLDADYAGQTMFKGRIAHGMLSASLISTVFGTRLPGPGAIYISQTLKFKAPVKIGDTAVARVEVIELLPEKKRATFKTTVSVGATVVVDGEAVLMVPSRG
ncbi:MAG: MaoC family dehydratase [Telmatospirillum sp.]|nr:MaoC family dehydratase [Telmatospirillum sp.]